MDHHPEGPQPDGVHCHQPAPEGGGLGRRAYNGHDFKARPGRMKGLKTRRCNASRAPAPPSLQGDLDGDWGSHTHLKFNGCAVPGDVTAGGNDHGPLLRQETTGAVASVKGVEVTMLNQGRVPMKLGLQVPYQHGLTLEILKVD